MGLIDRTTGKDEWLTPPEIFKPLQPFDLDVCEPIQPPWRIGKNGSMFSITDSAKIGTGSFGATHHTAARLIDGSLV